MLAAAGRLSAKYSGFAADFVFAPWSLASRLRRCLFTLNERHNGSKISWLEELEALIAFHSPSSSVSYKPQYLLPYPPTTIMQEAQVLSGLNAGFDAAARRELPATLYPQSRNWLTETSEVQQ